MTTQLEKWLDESNHQGDVTPAEVLNAKTQGYVGAIIDLYQTSAVQQLTAWRDAGFRLRAYIYLNFPGGDFYSGKNAADQASVALALCAGFTIEKVYLDCEDPKDNLDAAGTVDFIAGARDIVVASGFACGIYTASGWWRQFTGDTHDFAGLPLWLATDNDVPDLAFADPFGGWTELDGNQDSWHARDIDPNQDFDESVMRGAANVAVQFTKIINTDAVTEAQRIGTHLAEADAEQNGEFAAIVTDAESLAALGVGPNQTAYILVVNNDVKGA